MYRCIVIGALNVMLKAMLHDILQMSRFAYENGTTGEVATRLQQLSKGHGF